MSPSRDKVSSVKKLMVVLLSLTLITSAAPFAAASKSVPYKSQKAGQFCKTVDIGKKVSLPDGSALKCKKDGARARWSK
jgi:hypothetical protein